MYHHMQRQAAGCLGTAINIYASRAQYRRAHQLMQIFEKKSGFFDKSGKIYSGPKDYYYVKGSYYNNINKTDSAEYYFRKLLDSNAYLACKGLLNVYRQTGETDSIIKFSNICEIELTNTLDKIQTNSINLSSSLYNYTQIQKESNEYERRVERARLLILALIFLGLFFGFISLS